MVRFGFIAFPEREVAAEARQAKNITNAGDLVHGEFQSEQNPTFRFECCKVPPTPMGNFSY
jgi:hypothetical protein